MLSSALRFLFLFSTGLLPLSTTDDSNSLSLCEEPTATGIRQIYRRTINHTYQCIHYLYSYWSLDSVEQVAVAPKLKVVIVDKLVETPKVNQAVPGSAGVTETIADNKVIAVVKLHLFAPFVEYSNAATNVAIAVTNRLDVTMKRMYDDVKDEAMKAISTVYWVTVDAHLENTVELVYLVATEY